MARRIHGLNPQVNVPVGIALAIMKTLSDMFRVGQNVRRRTINYPAHHCIVLSNDVLYSLIRIASPIECYTASTV